MAEILAKIFEMFEDIFSNSRNPEATSVFAAIKKFFASLIKPEE